MSSSQRIAILARQKNSIFHVGDLAKLWNISNMNSLYTLLTRYVQRGLLFRVYKGLYSLHPLEGLDPLLLGIKALHRFAYVSTETILVREGLMQQIVYHYTLVSSCSTRFRIGPHSFICRQLKDEFLYHPAGISEQNGILIASEKRALADLFYFNPKAFVDGINLVNPDELYQIQRDIGYPANPIHHVTSP